MFSYLKGTICDILPTSIVLEVNNIGYSILVPNSYVFNVSWFYKIYIYTHVRDFDITLYGFLDLESKELFLKLLSVSGIGPRTALAILASNSISSIIDAINNSDSKFFSSVQGIGVRTAQQIILDLKGKIDFKKNDNGVIEALKALGYKEIEYNNILNLLDFSLDTSTILKQALKLLNSK